MENEFDFIETHKTLICKDFTLLSQVPSEYRIGHRSVFVAHDEEAHQWLLDLMVADDIKFVPGLWLRLPSMSVVNGSEISILHLIDGRQSAVSALSREDDETASVDVTCGYIAS